LLDEAATTLSKLSQEQMKQVLAHFDAALKTADAEQAEKEMGEAYLRHREILQGLRGLLVQYDAIRNLDQAAERLDKDARTQVDLGVRTARGLQLYQEAMDKGIRDDVRIGREFGRPFPRGREQTYNPLVTLNAEMPQLSDEQRDLTREVGNV